MEESWTDDYVNDFVVKVESGHPGAVNYHLIATAEAWRKLAAELTETCEESMLASLPIKNESGETHLFERYATISKGQTSRLYITFWAAKNLGVHHIRSTRSQGLWNQSGWRVRRRGLHRNSVFSRRRFFAAAS